jgi:choice-of-anchor A domain-containing protein
MVSKKLLLFAAAITAFPGICHADNLLGVAGAYNLVALGGGSDPGTGNITTSSDITGRIAAANEILGGTTIGSAFQSHQADPNGFAGAYAIVAGNDAGSSAHFNVNGGGNVYASGNSAGNFNLANEGGGTVKTTGPSPIDFNNLRTSLDSETLTLAALTSTGNVLGTNQPGHNPQWLVLSGTSSTLNIFNITAAQFYNGGAAIDIDVPLGSTVIINVDGAQVNLNTGIFLNGTQESDQNNDGGNILFNFYNAANVNIQGQLDGSILAPFAIFNGNSQLGGTIVAAEIDSTGEVHNIEFTGTVPPTDPTPPTVPEPTSLTLLGTGILGLAGMLRRKKPTL